MAWPEHGAPVSGAGMIDLIDQVTRAQQQTGNKAIIIHCRSGEAHVMVASSHPAFLGQGVALNAIG